MSKILECENIVAFHPGYYIADIIEDIEIDQSEFADKMGISDETLIDLINGRIGILNDIAKKLSVMLGMSVDVWLNLQNTYDWKALEIQQILDSRN